MRKKMPWLMSFLILVLLAGILTACSKTGDAPQTGTDNQPVRPADSSKFEQDISILSDQELLYRYVDGLELAFRDRLLFEDPREIPTEELFTLFLCTLDTQDNAQYAEYEKRWLSAEDGKFHIPIADIEGHLSTVLEVFNLNPSKIYGYNSDEKAVIIPTISGFGGGVFSQLRDKTLEGNTLILTVDIYTDDSFQDIWCTKQYTIRFEETGYKYLSIIRI